MFFLLGALVHVLHRPAAAIRALERVQRGDQAEYVQRHHLPQPDVYNSAHQLQQLQATDEQQGVDLRQVRSLTPHGRDASLFLKELVRRFSKSAIKLVTKLYF